MCFTAGRSRELSEQLKKLEHELETVQRELSASQQTNQALIDEHHALQLAYNSHEKKLKEVETENDRLVSGTHTTPALTHMYTLYMYILM